MPGAFCGFFAGRLRKAGNHMILDKNYCVYRHTAPNGKVYIGLTCQEPEKRWLNGKGYRDNIHFSRAIEKYGWKNIRHEIVYDGLTRAEASYFEAKLIAESKSNVSDYGYNLTTGGEIGFKYTEESLKKLSDAHKKINKDGRNSKRNIGGKNAIAKKIYQYSRCGVIVAEYDSIADAARYFALSGKAKSFETARIHIMNAANNRYIKREKYSATCRTAYGFVWKYDKEDNFCEKAIIKNRNSQTRSINQYTKDGKFIKTYNSVTEAATLLGKQPSHLTRCAKGQNSTAYGYIWEYSDTENQSELVGAKVKSKMHGGKMWSHWNHSAKSVAQYDLEMNFIKIYPCIADASRELGIDHSCISACAANKSKTAGGFIWKYAGFEGGAAI